MLALDEVLLPASREFLKKICDDSAPEEVLDSAKRFLNAYLTTIYFPLLYFPAKYAIISMNKGCDWKTVDACKLFLRSLSIYEQRVNT